MSEAAKSSLKNRLSRIGTADGAEDPYDHAIDLIDATTSTETSTVTTAQSEQSGWRQLARSATQTSVKDHLARRKYAKWRQEDEEENGSKASSTRPIQDGGAAQTAEKVGPVRGKKVQHAEHSDSAAVDFGHAPDSPEARHDQPKKKNKKPHKHKEKPQEESAVDILYENQRGSFFCGIPLYSHSSLLQFDPAPWVNKDYKPSPVNITNAQVPDPSWRWEWKHWYVDMSNDVDEDGWQYSFAFFGNFSWHGTHPWFHSFCRRRRWLRKRTKSDQVVASANMPRSMSEAHHLNTDYFTIHSKRDRSPSLAEGGPQTARPESYMSYRTQSTVDDEPEEIDNVAALLKALRLATIDREKIDVVKKFIEGGGEELAYLKEQIPEIMHFLVFQNSRRQVLEMLRQEAAEARQHRDEHDAANKPEGEAESRKIDNLLKAAEVADEQIRGLEYWSDRKHVMVITDDTNSSNQEALKTVFDKQKGDPHPHSSESFTSGIKGISKDAEIGSDLAYENVYRGATLARAGENSETSRDKGKGKMKAEEPEDHEGNDPEDTERLSPRLKADQMMIPEGE